MRLKNFLNDDESDIEKIIPILKRDCSEILKIYALSDRYLLRAFKGRFSFKKVKPLKNRKPVDTPKDMHKLYNDLFYEKFGWKPRSEGVFTSPSYYYTRDFGGNTYVVFPKNGFKYICEPKATSIWRVRNALTWDERHDKDYMTQKYKEAVSLYTDNNLLETLNGGYYDIEIVIKCDHYYLLDYEMIIELMKYKDSFSGFI